MHHMQFFFHSERSISALAVARSPRSDYHSGTELFTLNAQFILSKPEIVNDF